MNPPVRDEPHAAAPVAGAAWFADPQALTQEARLHLAREGGIGQIAGYEIRERISRGGQGSVLAAIDTQTRAPVAVKVLNDGVFASAAGRRRFEREIEVVAELHHPSIVPVLASGVTAGGAPYLVMPRIVGVDYAEWAAGRRESGVAEIIELHAALCEAIQHAHQRGVIHRDLKPGNVLVDAANRPHVLDFGLAKPAASRDAAAAMSMTQEEQFVGSLAWTSPEQLSGDRRAIDTRTDIYSLGVMLYHALTGKFPYAVEGALHAVVHGVMNVMPVRPGAHNPTVSGDLDAIVLKAMAKSPNMRYATAGEFAADLRNLLHGRASRARREQSLTALQRNVRRYQAIVGISAALLALSAALYVRAHAARAQAEREAAKSRAAANFLEGLFDAVNPSGDGLSVTVARVLDRAAARVPVEFANEPETAAGLHFMLGNAYGRLGRPENSEQYLRSFELRRTALGEDHPATLDAALYVARSDMLSMASRLELMERVRTDRVRRLPALHPDVIFARYVHAGLLQESGDIRGCLAAIDNLLETVSSGLPPDDRLRHNVIGVKITNERQYGDLRRAIEWADGLDTLLRDNLDPEYEHRLALHHYRAEIALVQERYVDAERQLQSARAIRESVFSGAHISSIATNWELALCWIGQGRLGEAERLLRSDPIRQPAPMEAVWRCSSRFVRSMHRLHRARGEFDEAIGVLERWLDERAAITGGRSGWEQLIRCDLLATLVESGRWGEALPLAEELREFLREQPLALHLAARVKLDYAACLRAIGRGGEAAALVDEAYATLIEILGPDQSWTCRAEAMRCAAR